MLAMKRKQRASLGRPTPIWTVGAVFVMVAAGCSTMVDGKPMAEVLSAGQLAPVEWGPCRVVGGGGRDAGQIRAGAQCGKITVPIDYSKPDGAVANLALIRFPATGQKIGSLVINPGGPGGSGVGAAVGLMESLPPQIRQRFDLVGFDPRGVGSFSRLRSRCAWCRAVSTAPP